MPESPQNQVTLRGLRTLMLRVFAAVVVSLACIVGGYWLDNKNEEKERTERRENTCHAVEAVAGGVEEFLAEFFAPDPEATPEERAEREAEIAAGRVAYHEKLDPALAECGQTD